MLQGLGRLYSLILYPSGMKGLKGIKLEKRGGKHQILNI